MLMHPESITVQSPFAQTEIEGIAQPRTQETDTETYSVDILGPVWFKLSNLRAYGSNTRPAAPSQSKYIIAEDEQFSVSLDVEFNKTPLSALLMCLGTRLTVHFAFEGFGNKAQEIDLVASIKTVKGQYKYTVTYTSVPSKEGLTPGLYEVAAVVDFGPVENECKTPVFGHGYIQEALLQVYPAGQDF